MFVALPADNEVRLPIFETVLNGITVVGSIVGTRKDLREVFELHKAGLDARHLELRARCITSTRRSPTSRPAGSPPVSCCSPSRGVPRDECRSPFRVGYGRGPVLHTEARRRSHAYGGCMTVAAPPDGTAADPERLRDALGSGYPPRPVEVRETHISWVFLVGDRAYKLKKPVVLDFLNYGTPARRHAMCHEELTLNARLAPDLYLSVKAVAAQEGRLELTDENDPAAIDYVVEMRRYDEHATLAALADLGQVTPVQMAMVGERLAAFRRLFLARGRSGIAAHPP